MGHAYYTGILIGHSMRKEKGNAARMAKEWESSVEKKKEKIKTVVATYSGRRARE